MDFFTWKHLLRNLVLPPTGPLLLAILGLALMRWRGLRATGTALCGTGLALLWLFATPVVGDALVRSTEHFAPLDLNSKLDADAIVVLAGGVRLAAPEYGTAAPGATTLQRLAYAARVQRATGLPLLVSGSPFEAASMNEFLQKDFAVPVKWVEHRSRDTHENAQMSAAILVPAGVRTVVLVTTSSHMKRAVAEFRATGLAVIAAPADIWTQDEYGVLRWVPNVNALARSQVALYEIFGNLVLMTRETFESRHS